MVIASYHPCFIIWSCSTQLAYCIIFQDSRQSEKLRSGNLTISMPIIKRQDPDYLIEILQHYLHHLHRIMRIYC